MFILSHTHYIRILEHMRTIAVLKKVIDIIYEEKRLDDMINKRTDREKECAEKDEIIAELYRINIQLEHKIKQYEHDFEMIRLLHQTVDESLDEHKDKEEKEKQQEEKKEQQEDIPPKKIKKDRKEYIKEYQKQYRLKKKQKKIEMTL